ncbi:hypothetical protein ABTD77_20650, partial [Acinetobacter baumannii]
MHLGGQDDALRVIQAGKNDGHEGSRGRLKFWVPGAGSGARGDGLRACNLHAGPPSARKREERYCGAGYV